VGDLRKTFGTFFDKAYFCTPNVNLDTGLGYGVTAAQQILILFV
jgi:hypothetical protein